MSTLIVFGAGASAYCGTGTVQPSLPPLGNDLYKSLSQLEGMETLLNVSPEIKTLLENDFEKGFEEYLSARDDPRENPIKFMCGLAYYFTQFDISPLHANENLYVRLLKLLIATKKRYVFSTLNYEVLLESAAMHSGIKTRVIGACNQPHKLSDTICIIKPHGACNLMVRNNPLQLINTKISGFKSLGTTGTPEPFERTEAARVLSKFNNEDFNLASLPAISQYMPSKHVDLNGNYVEEQRETFKRKASSAARILIVGVKLHEEDKHVWEPISGSSANIGFVGLVTDEEKQIFNTWRLKNQKKRKITHLHEKFEQCFEGDGLSEKISRFLNGR